MKQQNSFKPIKEELCVAFLDLLGFKSKVYSGIANAKTLLDEIHHIYMQKINDYKNYPSEIYPTPELRKLAKECSNDTFVYGIQISDSLIIVSRNPSLFAAQISHYLHECFILNQTYYPNHVFNRTNEMKKDFPLALFRGGISYGETAIFPSPLYYGSEKTSSINIVGKAMIEASSIEKIDHGPRLFCCKSFIDRLDDYTLRFVQPLVMQGKETKDVYELIWPGLLFIKRSSPNVEIGNIEHLLRPVLNLEVFYRNHKAHIHYIEYIRLIVRGALLFFDEQLIKQKAIKAIKEKVDLDILIQIPEWNY